MNLQDIGFKNGSVNPSGIGTEVFFVFKSDINAWPEIEDDFDAADITPAKYVNYEGDFVLAAEKAFTRLYTTFGKGKINSEPTGEADCKMHLNKATLMYPKFTDDIRAFIKMATNGDFVFVVKHDGGYYLIGHIDYPCVVSPSTDSGDAAGSAKGVTISLECPDVTAMPKYMGDLLLSDGTLDCATGVFTPKTP